MSNTGTIDNLSPDQKRQLLEQLLARRKQSARPGLSQAQQRLWFLGRLEPDNSDYNLLNAYRLVGKLDRTALKGALVEVVQRHETLRTVFAEENEVPYQVIQPGLAVTLEEIDLRHLSPLEAEQEAHRLAVARTQKPFDIERGPLFRFLLFQLEEQVFVFATVLHHIICDNLSIMILNSEISALYDRFVAGLASDLEKLPRQYRDFVAWEREHHSPEALSDQLSYWRKALANMKVAELNSDRPRPRTQTHKGATFARMLSGEVSRGFESLSRDTRYSLFMIYLAAFQLLLHRYTGSRDLNCGTAITNRDLSDFEKIIGFFVNIQVMRNPLTGDPTFMAFLTQVFETALGAYENPHVPFDRLVEELRPERDSSRNPLCQITFQQGRLPHLNLAGLDSENRWDVDYGIARFDLEFNVMEKAGGAELIIVYNSDLYEPETIRMLAANYEHLLSQILADPHRAVSQYETLAPVEKARLMAWSTLVTPYPRDKTIPDLFEEYAQSQPQAPALIDQNGTMTYAALHQQANRMAHFLIEQGIQREEPVGITLDSSNNFMVLFLAVLKAGACYLPLDPEYPHERLAYIMGQSGARTILAMGHQAEKIGPACPAGVNLINVETLDLSPWPSANPAVQINPDQVAYIIYTSGSTGQPKGIGNTHRNVARLVRNTDYVDVKPGDVMLQVHSISFDGSVFEIWGSVLNGATLVMMETGAVETLPGLVTRHGVTILSVTSPVFHLLVDEHMQSMSQVRQMMTGGDTTSLAHVARFLEYYPNKRLMHMYGPTESTVFASSADLGQFDGMAVPIGTPLANTCLRVLDENLTLIPAGAVGEICIGGDGLARGYIGRPALTAEKFVPDPYSSEVGKRLYKSGDHGRYRQDGHIAFVGRVDGQVKVRGFRVEAGEIESRLAPHPQIRDCHVSVIKDDSGNKLYAWYTTRTVDQPLDFAELVGFLDGKLPSYMIPSGFVHMQELPLTRHGKIDKKLLPLPAAGTSSSYAAPRSPQEKLLVQIWSEVLGIENPGIYDNYFELGGDSIMSIKVIARANRAGLNLSVQQIFVNQTIAALAAAADLGTTIHAEQDAISGRLQITPMQRWFLETRGQFLSHFYMGLNFQLEETLPSQLLEEAMTRLCGHHDALRLRFFQQDGRWFADHGAPDVSNLFGLKEWEHETPQALEWAVANLNIEQGPLVCLARAGNRLQLVCHHLVVDAVSLQILGEDLNLLLSRGARQQAARLPSKTTAFKTFAAKLSAFSDSEPIRNQKEFWDRQTIEPAQGLLPAEAKPGTYGQTACVRIRLEKDQTRKLLQQTPAVYNTRINDMLLTPLVLLAHRLSGWAALRLDLEGHGRENLFEEVDLTRTSGWFTARYPVLLQLDPWDNPGEALKQVKEQLRQIPLGGIGYGLLQQDAAPAQVGFNYLGRALRQNDEGLLKPAEPFLSGGSHPQHLRAHALEIACWQEDDSLEFLWFYNGSEQNEARIQTLAEDYIQELNRLIDFCLTPGVGGRTPSDFPLTRLNQESIDRILKRWPEAVNLVAASPMQQGMLMHSLIGDHSRRYTQQLHSRLSGKLDPKRFQQAWEQVTARHALLRTVFVLDEGEPLQLVLAHDRPEWQYFETSSPQAANIELFLEQDLARPWSLSEKPPQRFTLIQDRDGLFHFIWTMHHALLDGWSLPILMREAAAFYRSAGGAAPQLPHLRPYSDYIAWQRSKDPQKAGAWWQTLLEGFTEATPLPRCATKSTAADHASQEKVLDSRLHQDLTAFSRRTNVTLGAVIQAAWGLLLGRYSETTDVVFGLTVAGRPAELEGVEQMVGMFINTLPSRVDVASPLPIRQWLARQQQQQAASREFEYSSLAEIQARSKVGKTLFDTIVVFENYPLEGALIDGIPDVTLEGISIFEKVEYPLVLQALPGRELVLKSIYDPRRFDAAFIARMFGHLAMILRGFVDLPEARPGDLEILTASERQQLLQEWNNTTHPFDDHKAMHQLFEDQVRNQPGATACVFADETLTYEALNNAANRLAHHLLRLGVQPGDFVGVRLKRSNLMALALQAILKAGGAYAPMDAAYPEDRVAYILEQTGARILLTESSLAADHGVVSLLLDQQDLAAEPEHNPELVIDTDQFAYVIFTSGSTGRPKGVVEQHKPVVNLIQWVNNSFDVGADDRLLFTTSLCFDLSVYDVFGILGAGGTVVTASEEEVRNPALLTAKIADSAITFWDSAPAALQQLVPELPGPGQGSQHLRLVFLSGDWIPLSLPPTLQKVFPRVEVIALGGATEATIWSNFFPVTEVDPSWNSIPYGRPIQNAHYHILDYRLRPQPVGLDGDLFIADNCLSFCYYKQPRATALSFIPNPFSLKPGAVMYRTGDRARRFANGVIEFLGRLDHQVKIRGFRIELGEVEAVLQELDLVQTAVVAPKDFKDGDRRLVAYIQLDPEDRQGAPDPALFRNHLKHKLPDYMLPSAFIILEQLPVTANGKLDRKALPHPEELVGDKLQVLATGNALEARLAEIWFEVLGTAVDPESNFFEAGGHSLLVTQVVSQIRRVFGLSLPLNVPFEKPRLRDLAEHLMTLLEEQQPEQLESWRRTDHNPAPLSFAQERLWFLHRLEPDNPFYNTMLALRISGDLNADLLSQSFDRVIERHENLRTHFEVRGDEPVQVVTPAVPLNLEVVDRNALAGNREALLEELNEMGRMCFDLSKSPIFTVHLLQLQPREHILVLLMHHIVVDGWSMGLLMHELAVCYRALSQSQPVPLAELPMQYGDFSAWQRQYLQGAAYQKEAGYWKNQLAGADPLLVLPYDKPRGPQQTFVGKTSHFVLDAQLTAQIEERCLELDCTLFMYLLSAYQILIAWFSGKRDILVGTDVANRTRAETEGLIGFFVNQLVLRGRLDNNPSFAELVAQARTVTLEAYNHQEIPFNKLVEELNPKRENYPPIFQVKLVLQNAPEKEHHFPGLTLELVDWDRGTAQLDLLLVANSRGGTLNCAFEFNTDLFLPTTITRLQEHFQQLTQKVTQDPQLRLETLLEELQRQDAELEKQQRASFRKMGQARLASFKKFKK